MIGVKPFDGEANRFADRKWDLIFGEVIPRAQAEVAAELGLPDPNSLVFAPNTHDLLLRVFSAIERRPVRILSTDGEFHSFRRQADRWEEAGQAVVTRVALAPFETFAERFVAAAQGGGYDVVCSRAFASLVDFTTWSRSALMPGAVWMAMKGKHPADELAALPPDVSVFHVEQLVVPGLDAERCIVWLRPSPLV